MKNNKRRSPIARGFTLVEMMAVVVIIAILAAVIGPRIFNQVNKTQEVRAKKDIESISQAISMYRLDTNQFPEDLKDLQRNNNDIKGWRGPYLKKPSISDPWDNPYQYRVPGMDNRDFDVWSTGADGQEGGEGLDADITSWDEEDNS